MYLQNSQIARKNEGTESSWRDGHIHFSSCSLRTVALTENRTADELRGQKHFI